MPLFRPRVTVRRGPGLIGAAARTAVIAGTATAVTGGMRRRQAGRAQQQADQQAAQQAAPQIPAQQAPAEPTSPVGGLDDAAFAKLERLAELQKQGILTEEEFAQQKAAILRTI